MLCLVLLVVWALFGGFLVCGGVGDVVVGIRAVWWLVMIAASWCFVCV